MLIPPSTRKHSRIPLISLIDMTFMLFIFFILVTRFSNLDQVELNIGNAKVAGATNASPPNLLYLRLTADMIQLGDTQIPYTNLRSAIKPYFPGHVVVIEAGTGSTVQQMVDVLDTVKLAGATDITLKETP